MSSSASVSKTDSVQIWRKSRGSGQLLDTRETLLKEIVGNMPVDHRRFLIGFDSGEPDWSLLGLEHVPELPAIRWRQLNLDKLSAEARSKLVESL